MSVLSSLECIEINSKSVRTNQIGSMRQKLIDRISDQIELAHAIEAGASYQRTRFRRVQDLETGDITQVPTKTRVRPWWIEDRDGSILLWVKYGNQNLEVQKGKTAIRLASKQEITSTLDLVRTAVRAGEFDDKIKGAVKGFQERFRKAKKS
jgi:hypothetical protein